MSDDDADEPVPVKRRFDFVRPVARQTRPLDTLRMNVVDVDAPLDRVERMKNVERVPRRFGVLDGEPDSVVVADLDLLRANVLGQRAAYAFGANEEHALLLCEARND